MIKRKILGVALPLVSALAIVGSGFAAWNFQDTSKSETNGIGVVITSTTSALGDFTYIIDDGLTKTNLENPNMLRLVLDQGGYANYDKENYGISIKKYDASEPNPESWTTIKSLIINYQISSEDIEKYESAGLRVKITTSLSLSTDLLTYVSYTGTTSNSVTFDDVAKTPYTFTYDLTTFSYESGKKPTTSDSYDKMKDDLDDDDDLITITCVAELVSI